MKSRPHILITNDDGIHAPGILHLWKSLVDFADITIVAPDSEQSASGLSITIRKPLSVKQVNWPHPTPAWTVSGTPADCVKLALSVILKDQPDLVLSGINRGSNAGRGILYSGTVAAVIEGLLHDIPGIAFSCYEYQNPNYNQTVKYVPTILRHVMENPLPKGTFLNINVPGMTGQVIKGFKMTRQGKEYIAESPDHRLHPTEGHSYYWLGAKIAKYQEDEDGEIAWLNRGYLTAVPIHIEQLTDHSHLEKYQAHFDGLHTN